MEVMRACMFEYTTLIWRVCQKWYTSSPHRARSVHDGVVVLATSTRLEGFMHTHACVCAQSVSCMSSQSKNNNPLLSQINLSYCQAKSSDGPSGPTNGKHQYADNRLSECERTTTTALHVGQTYICWIPKMHNFDVPHASKTVNHAPTQSEVHIKRTTYDGPLPPSSPHTIYMLLP